MRASRSIAYAALLALIEACGGAGPAPAPAAGEPGGGEVVAPAATPSRPEPVGAAVRFPEGWRGPCETHARLSSGPAVLRFEGARAGGCLVPLTVVAAMGLYGCPEHAGFTDEPASRHPLAYDAEGRMISDGYRSFVWDGDRLVEAGGSPVRLRIDRGARVVELGTPDVTSALELDDRGFPVRDRVLSMARDLAYEGDRLVRISMHGGTWAEVELDYCDGESGDGG